LKPSLENVLKIHRMEIVWTFIGNRMDFLLSIIIVYFQSMHGYSIKIVWIYYGFSGTIANLIIWISHREPPG
jgi:hypothetical protein